MINYITYINKNNQAKPLIMALILYGNSENGIVKENMSYFCNKSKFNKNHIDNMNPNHIYIFSF